MYYPKNQIETGLYSNSNFIITSTNKVYIGPYFKTSDGKFYTGKEPNDGPNHLLTPAFPKLQGKLPYEEGYEFPDPRFDQGNNNTYSILTQTPNPGRNSRFRVFSPIPYYPILTDVEKGNGQFIRYILKKSNENIYYEVGKNNCNDSLRSKLYMRIILPWIISGDKEKVAKANAKQVELIERLQKIDGLGKFLKHNYLQFYQG